MPPSPPVSIAIPAIGVHSKVFDVGRNPDGTIQVPPLDSSPLTNEAAWYRYSSTPGALGSSVIEGHVDSTIDGPSVFYRLGALVPGQRIYVTRKDHTTAVFQVTGVRQYSKAAFPDSVVYGSTGYAALRLVTCGGQFDPTTRHYLSNTVVFAALTSSPAGH
jgi:sortase (surface protein transpeptidase)